MPWPISSRKFLWRAIVYVVLAWLPVSILAKEASGDRIALVIGNSEYQASPLTNPTNDANAMAALLGQAAFDVDLKVNAGRKDLQAAIARFGEALRAPKVRFAIFYYAGHGVQLDWRNYLIPIDAKIRTADDVRRQLIDISELLRYMDQTRDKSFLVILDACRDDPFGSAFQTANKGLSQFDGPVGSLLAYSTSPGNVAMDGNGSNGLYTSHLLRELAVRNTRLEDAFKRVRLNVRLESNGKQVPWESTSLEEDIYLFQSEKIILSEADQEALMEGELRSWRLVKGTADPQALANFIRQYPSGNTSELAQSRLNRLLAQASRKIAQDAAKAEVEAARQRAEELRLVEELQQALAVQRIQEQAQRVSAAAERFAQAQTEANKVVPPAPAPAPISLPEPEPAKPMVLAATPYYQGYEVFARQFTVGDHFGFRIIDQYSGLEKPLDLAVTAVDSAQDFVEYNQGEYTSDLMGNTTRNVRGRLDSPRQFYPSELFIGKKWKTQFKQTRANGTVYTFKYDLRVVAKEKVTVPAGTFNTYRIEARGFNMELGAALQRNIWVATGVNADIAHETLVRLRNGRVEQADRQELVRYIPADKHTAEK